MKLLLAALTTVMALSIATVSFAGGGHYAGGHGSSHKGGHYKNSSTGNHYQHRK